MFLNGIRLSMASSDPKLRQRGVVLVIPMPGMYDPFGLVSNGKTARKAFHCVLPEKYPCI
jgi:hypothetical protein